MQPHLKHLLLAILLLVLQATCITKYDFNVCRIKFCSDKESSCVADEGDCMKAFAATRQCFTTCTSADQLATYNKCWLACKQTTAYNSNSLYYAVGQCYENNCYLSEKYYTAAVMLFSLIMFFMIL